MSKETQEPLFELIKSLSKSEKRYFKLHISRHSSNGNSNYATLFDYIDRSGQYNEQEIISHFKNEPFLNNFSITKRRLYDQIITSLNGYHSTSSVDAQLYKMLQGATILYNKALYSQATKLLNSASKLAEKYERHTVILEISQQQQRLQETKHYSSIKIEEVEELQNRSNAAINQLQIQTGLWFTKSKLFMELNQKGLTRDDRHRNKLEEYHHQIKEQCPTTALSVSNTYLYNHIEAAYYFAINDFEKSMVYLSNNIRLLESNLFLLEEFPNYYFGTLSNAVYIAEQLHQPEQADALLDKIKTFPTAYNLHLSDDLTLKMFLSSSSIELSMLTSRGEFVAAREIIPVIESGLKLHAGKIPIQKQLYFAYLFAGIHIGLTDFSGGLKWINTILNTPNMESNEEIVAYTHILNLIVHLELKNDQLLPYALKSTQRFLKTRNRLHTFEQIILQFISGFNSYKQLDQQEAWEKLHDELHKLRSTNEPEFQKMKTYFDFETWAKSKLTNKRFDELIRERNN
ncbi:MAG: hypothetical protein KF704_10575 [Crocinitomicaceae bacterium]|nr:hypothetical protein [Crocinitomicaceae bacterium]NGF76132.1 hypothetical protein [Fluviicola sp. SGL-29]